MIVREARKTAMNFKSAKLGGDTVFDKLPDMMRFAMPSAARLANSDDPNEKQSGEFWIAYYEEFLRRIA